MRSAGHDMAPVRIGVCVDDVGLRPGVAEAALDLCRAGRVSALSCMSDAPAWREAAATLVPELRGAVDFGLHLTFTEPWSGSRLKRPLRALIVAAHARALDGAAARDDIRRQLDAFEDAVDEAPDFVDGHQHVHQLPLIRDALVDELAARYGDRKPWLRHTGAPRRARCAALPNADEVKERVIEALGAGGLRRLARIAGFEQNGHLLGVYGFTGSAEDYLARWRRWCAQASSGDLLMCHPATPGDDRDDPIARARAVEYGVLCDERAAAVRDPHRVEVVRLSAGATTEPSELGRSPSS